MNKRLEIMLNHISIWQMVIDVCLVTSILVMAFRYAKSTRVHALLPRVVELEGRISVLMAETEGRAKHISEQLLRREQSLKAHISDLEKREKELGINLDDGDALTKELALLGESARREALELERLLAEVRQAREEQIPAKRGERRREYERLRDPSSIQDSQLTESRAEDYRSSSTRGESRRAAEWLDQAASKDESVTSSNDQQTGVKTLMDSYKAAEEMLKMGRGATEVSERTSLPIEGVKRLAQMIEIERDERSDVSARYSAGRASADPRLGALGVSRRSTSAL